MPNVLHTIKAWLYDNPLTKKNPRDFMARASIEKSLDITQICNSAVTRGGAPTTVAAMEMNTMLFLKEMAYLLSDGYSVNTGYFTANADIQGVFDNAAEPFSPGKHSVVFRFRQGALLRRELEDIKVEILGVAQSGLFVSQVTDIKTGTVNDAITPNRNLRISGRKIRLAGDRPEVGVYFVGQATQEWVKVDASDIIVNNPSELVIVVPQLAAGGYKLQITSQFGGNTRRMLREPQTTVFDKILTVG
ncbi:MAG: DNA-binding domain-containing protein [Breznakibacter sp.]